MGLLDGMGHMFSGGGGVGSGYDEVEMALFRAQLQAQLAQEDDARSMEYLKLQNRLAHGMKDRELAKDAYLADDVSKRTDELFSPLLDEVSKDGYSPALRQIVGTMRSMAASGNPDLQKVALGSFDNLLGRMTPPAQNPDSLLTNDVKNFRFAQSQGYQGSFADFLAQDAQNRRQQININQNGENEYVKARAKAEADAFNTLQGGAESAWKQRSSLDQFIKASQGGYEGGAADLLSGVGNMMSSFGINIDPKGLTDTRLMEQAVGNILGSRMAELGARGLTDKDMLILREALPRVDTDRQSREAIAQILKKTHDATIRQYRDRLGWEQSRYPDAQFYSPSWLPDWEKSMAPQAPLNIKVERIK